MVGQGVLRECLLDPEIERVLAIARSTTGQLHPKLRELAHQDFLHFEDIEEELAGFDVCFFCLGVSSVGMAQERYRQITYDITMAAAETLARLNPGMTFVYVSGMGTDSSERGRTGWARVKGKTENALLRLPFRAAYMFRPGVIVPLNGIRSKTSVYRLGYAVLGPLLTWSYKHVPKYVTTTEQLGRAMIRAARQGAPKKALENIDINSL